MFSEEKFYKMVSFIFGVITLYIILHVFFRHPVEHAVGESFVIDEFILTTPIYNFHFKPLTLIMIFAFSFWMTGLEGWKTHIRKIQNPVKNALKLFLFLSILVFGYEFLQNFLMWTSFYIKFGGDYDLLYHQINPGLPKPVNFLFISKLFALFLGGAAFTFYFFEKYK